jgi:hypothetical protein
MDVLSQRKGTKRFGKRNTKGFTNQHVNLKWNDNCFFSHKWFIIYISTKMSSKYLFIKKVVCLFCFVCLLHWLDLLKHKSPLSCIYLTSLESLWLVGRGASRLFCNIKTYVCKNYWILNNFLLKIKLSQN